MLKMSQNENASCCYFEESGEVSEKTAYENLANAIVLQAVEDYRASYTKICKRKKAIFDKEGREASDIETGINDYRNEVLRFISSPLFGNLTTVKSEYLINHILDEETEWVKTNKMTAFASY